MHIHLHLHTHIYIYKYVNVYVYQANALLEEYKKAAMGLKPVRKMSREEGSHHDTLIDDWDIA